MKLLKKFKGVYFKLMISFLAIVLVSTIFIGIFSYLTFSSNFNEFVFSLKDNQLENLGKMLEESIIKKAQQEFVNLAGPMQSSNYFIFFINNPLSGNYDKVLQFNKYLKERVLVSHGVLHSIDVYIADSDVMISSVYGLKFDVSRISRSSADLMWFYTINSSEDNVKWLGLSQKADSTYSRIGEVFSYVKTYPYDSSGRNCKGFIAIHINERAVYEIIRSYGFDSMNAIYIVTSDGSLISTTNRDQPAADKVLSSIGPFDFSGESGRFVNYVNKVRSIITYTSLSSTGWKIINILPVDVFYEKLRNILYQVFAICLLTMVVGIVLSGLFTFNIYNPLKILIENLKKIFHSSRISPVNTENEYVFLADAFSNMSLKVKNLEVILETNMSLIKHNLVLRLLNHTVNDYSEFRERMKLIGLKFNYSCYCTIIIQIDYFNSNISLQDSHYIRYSLIESIENYNMGSISCFATELSDDSLGIIVNSTPDSQDLYIALCNFLMSQEKIFPVKLVFYIGRVVENPVDLYQSFDTAKLLQKYLYFMPENRIFTEDILMVRENSSLEIPDKIIEKIIGALDSNNENELDSSLDELIHLMKSSNYSADHCQQKLIYLLSVLSRYMHYLPHKKKFIGRELFEQFSAINNIDDAGNWIRCIAAEVIKCTGRRSEFKSYEAVDQAIDYIRKNLNSDLSLQNVARKVFLSASYFSRLFKSKTGTDFADYVSNTRLEMARELLLKTNMSVETIAAETGFSSAGYFIKVFKRRYGMTPKSYKLKAINFRALEDSM
ncbi:MAG: AraC family transcriptional regulator [Firmicutes bacterium]|nr:AraC family transcriptional regulator [Bacillota bacterium]